MKLIDLFAGIGGFSLAAHAMGWETVAFVEREPFCQAVLRKNYGNDIEIHDDIFEFSGKPFRGRVDIVTGGFPCQPFSAAGKRNGVNDERYLFPETLRVIREVQPAWVVLENVAGLLSMAQQVRQFKVGGYGYTRTPDFDRYDAIYTREEDMLLHEIGESLEREGYAVQPVVVPAVALDADHKRDRIWIVARHADKRGLPLPENPRVSGRAGSVPKRSRCDAADAYNAGNGAPVAEADAKRRPLGVEREQSQPEPDGHDRDASNAQIGGSHRGRDSHRDDGTTPCKRAGESCRGDSADALYSAGERRREKGRYRRSEPTKRVAGCGRPTSDTSNSGSFRRERQQTDDAGPSGRGQHLSRGCERADRGSDDTDTSNLGFQRSIRPDGTEGQKPANQFVHGRDQERPRRFENWLEAAGVFCRVPDGLPDELYELETADRVARLKALGNSIYWRVALEIFRAIEATNKDNG